MQKIVALKNTASKITSDIATVTPDMARSWLEKNEHNRRVASATIAKYASDMKAGRWELTGDAIRFDASGRMIDGQHRMLACIKADTPFKTFVMYGFDPVVQDVIDTGKGRKVQDVLSLRGISNSTYVSGAMRALLGYRDGYVSIRAAHYSTAELIETFERHPNITKSVSHSSFGVPRSSPRSTLALLHYVATTYLGEHDAAERMVQVFRTGVPSYHGDVMHVMRERFISFPAHGQKIDSSVANQTMHYAWNLFVQKKTIGVLRWQKEFIEIDGVDRSKL